MVSTTDPLGIQQANAPLNLSPRAFYCTKLSATFTTQVVLEQANAPFGPALFVAAYATSTLLFVPASALTIGAGAVYGPIYGTALVSCASTLGCTLAFLTSRYLARPVAEERLRGNAVFERLEERLPSRGARLVLLLRLTPAVPFALLNYMCGVPLELLNHMCSTNTIQHHGGRRNASTGGC